MALQQIPRPTMPNIDTEVQRWLDAIREQAAGQHWQISISSTPDGAEVIEVLHSKDRPIRDLHAMIAGGERTVVCRKTADGRVVNTLKLHRKGKA